MRQSAQPSALSTLHRWLAGYDGPERGALPAGELLHPVPLLALAVLIINDQVLKGGGFTTPWITGKLSDVAGLLMFPLLITATADCFLALAARVGLNVDFTLRLWKLNLSCAVTIGVFTAMKLSATVAERLAAISTALGIPATVVPDPTDLLAIPMVAIAGWLGRREIRRVARGRLVWLRRRWATGRRDVAEQLADAVACGADPATIARLTLALTSCFDGAGCADAERALVELR